MTRERPVLNTINDKEAVLQLEYLLKCVVQIQKFKIFDRQMIHGLFLGRVAQYTQNESNRSLRYSATRLTRSQVVRHLICSFSSDSEPVPTRVPISFTSCYLFAGFIMILKLKSK